MPQRSSYDSQAGFTLVEVMVAMVIVIVSLLGLLQSVNMVAETNLKNQLRDEAGQIGEKALNELMTADFDKTVFTNYSVHTGLRGVNKYFKVRGQRDAIGLTQSKNVWVRVSWTYKNTSSSLVTSSVKTNPL
jgi:type IV pilus assembly protein PilV